MKVERTHWLLAAVLAALALAIAVILRPVSGRRFRAVHPEGVLLERSPALENTVEVRAPSAADGPAPQEIDEHPAPPFSEDDAPSPTAWSGDPPFVYDLAFLVSGPDGLPLAEAHVFLAPENHAVNLDTVSLAEPGGLTVLPGADATRCDSRWATRSASFRPS